MSNKRVKYRQRIYSTSFFVIFYQQPETERILFKGGTALKIIYQSPRFSEDINFSGFNISIFQTESLILNALKEIETLGILVKIFESKKQAVDI